MHVLSENIKRIAKQFEHSAIRLNGIADKIDKQIDIELQAVEAFSTIQSTLSEINLPLIMHAFIQDLKGIYDGKNNLRVGNPA